MKRPTIADVAARARVSKSTVSHALSGKRPISAKTRLRIMQAIEELGYRPNPVAQRLAGGRSRTVAVVFPLLAPKLAAVEMTFIAGAASVINRADYTFLTLTHLDHRTDHLERFAASGLVDGFILMQVRQRDPRVEFLQRSNLPFVLIGRCQDNTGLIYVDVDIEQSLGQCVDHLAGLGHRAIAYLHGDVPDLTYVVRAVEGFRAACRRHNVTPLTRACTLSPESGSAAISALLADHPGATAVIVWNDMAAIGVVRAIEAQGRRIPADFSLISFDYSNIANLVPFQPTAVDVRGEAVAAQAAQLMLALLEGYPLPESQILTMPEFILGESTAISRSIRKEASG